MSIDQIPTFCGHAFEADYGTTIRVPFPIWDTFMDWFRVAHGLLLAGGLPMPAATKARYLCPASGAPAAGTLCPLCKQEIALWVSEKQAAGATVPTGLIVSHLLPPGSAPTADGYGVRTTP